MVGREFGYSFLLEQYKITNDIDLVGLFEYYTIASIIATVVPCGGICHLVSGSRLGTGR